MLNSKSEWRRRARAVRNGLTERQIADDSEAIAQRVLAMPEVRQAGSVLVYASVGSEVRTYMLIERLLAAGQAVAVPALTPLAGQSGMMTGYRIESLHHLAPDRYDILAPREDRRGEQYLVDRPGVALVPALMLNPQTGHRLGQGGGYYDRYLAGRPGCVPIALVFEEQLLGEGEAGWPSQPHDVPMRWIVTPKGVLGVTGGLEPRVSR